MFYQCSTVIYIAECINCLPRQQDSVRVSTAHAKSKRIKRHSSSIHLSCHYPVNVCIVVHADADRSKSIYILVCTGVQLRIDIIELRITPYRVVLLFGYFLNTRFAD